MQLGYPLGRDRFLGLGLSMILAESHCLVALTHGMIEGTNVQLIAPLLIAHDPFVLVRVV